MWLCVKARVCVCVREVHRERPSLHHMHSILNTPMHTHTSTHTPCTVNASQITFPTLKQSETHTQITCAYLHQQAHTLHLAVKHTHTDRTHPTHRGLSCSHRNSCSLLSSMCQQKRLPCLELSERTSRRMRARKKETQCG